MKITILLLAFCATVSCSRSQAIAPVARKPDIGTSQKRAAEPSNKQIAVESVQLFGLWNRSYSKLDTWKESNDPQVPHPELFDVLCTIQNTTDSAVQQGDFVVVTTVDFITAPTYAYSGDINKLIDEHNWGRVASMDDVKLEPLPYVPSHDKAQVTIKGFNLRKVVKEFSGKDDALWPWALRVNVRLLDREMTPVAKGDVILPIMPSDERLSAKR